MNVKRKLKKKRCRQRTQQGPKSNKERRGGGGGGGGVSITMHEITKTNKLKLLMYIPCIISLQKYRPISPGLQKYALALITVNKQYIHFPMHVFKNDI